MASVRELMLVLACELNEYMEMQYYTIISAIIAMVASQLTYIYADSENKP